MVGVEQMSKIDKVVLDRQTDVSGRIAELQSLRDQAQGRVDSLNRQIANLQPTVDEVTTAVTEVADLVAAGTIISEIVPVEEPPVKSPSSDLLTDPLASATGFDQP
jgi:hypothetical protein